VHFLSFLLFMSTATRSFLALALHALPSTKPNMVDRFKDGCHGRIHALPKESAAAAASRTLASGYRC